MKVTEYFRRTKNRPDRSFIKEKWIKEVISNPIREHVQDDGRIRLWGRIDEAGGKYLRVILLPDRETVHNAFFDRSFKP